MDEYIPLLNLGIEYNGLWHQTSDGNIRDNNKQLICEQSGINLLWIQEYSVKIPILISENTIELWSAYNKRIETYQFIINVILHKFGVALSPVTKEELEKYLNYAYSVMRKDFVPNNINITHPEIASEWEYEKNGSLRPEKFTAGLHTKVFWKCNQCATPHSYEMDLHHRTRGQGCLIASGKKIVPGLNDLKSLNLYVMQFWNYEKNNLECIDPTTLGLNLHKIVHWKCPRCGYEWHKEISVFQKLKKCKNCKLKISD